MTKIPSSEQISPKNKITALQKIRAHLDFKIDFKFQSGFQIFKVSVHLKSPIQLNIKRRLLNKTEDNIVAINIP